MTTTNSRKTMCGLVIGAVLLASTALADPNAPCPKGDRPCMGAKLQEKLGLTDEQAAQLQQLRTAQQEKTKAAQEAIKEKRKALEEAVQSGADEQTIRATAAELGTALGDAAVLRAQHVSEVKKILTSEQLEKWQQLKEEHKGWRGKMGRPRARGRGEGLMAAGKHGCPMKAEGLRGHWGPQGRRGHRDPQGPWGPRGLRDRMGPLNPENIIEMKDTDGDGKLTLKEFSVTKWPTPAERFKKADTNSDGFLTAEELKESMTKFMGPKDEPK